MARPQRTTPDADARRVYHNVAVTIDPARQLFNGAPSVVGAGRVEAVEVDGELADRARDNLATLPQVTVSHGDGSQLPPMSFDAILVNAGVTHPLDVWLEALGPGGRMILPLTATMPSMGPIGKGPLVLLTGATRTSRPGSSLWSPSTRRSGFVTRRGTSAWAKR